jgi:hypothetical protein
MVTYLLIAKVTGRVLLPEVAAGGIRPSAEIAVAQREVPAAAAPPFQVQPALPEPPQHVVVRV